MHVLQLSVIGQLSACQDHDTYPLLVLAPALGSLVGSDIKRSITLNYCMDYIIAISPYTEVHLALSAYFRTIPTTCLCCVYLPYFRGQTEGCDINLRSAVDLATGASTTCAIQSPAPTVLLGDP